jgi:hypothetical protein
MLIVVSASPFGFGSFDINLIIRALLTAPTRRAWERDGPGHATCTLSPAQMTLSYK